VSARKLAAALVAFAGGAAFTACLLALVDGMRDVAQTDGGFCASGGPRLRALLGTVPAWAASKQP
jgi:hypothetical protein